MQITKTPVKATKTATTRQNLIAQNNVIKVRSEIELIEVIDNYLDITDAHETMKTLSFIHQFFIEEKDVQENFTSDFLSSVNFQLKEFLIMLSQIQSLNTKINASKRILNTLTDKKL